MPQVELLDHAREEVGAEVKAQLSRAAEDLVDARARVGEDEAPHALWMVERILQREDAAPRLAHQVHWAESERCPHCLELLDEARDDPERGVVGHVRLSAAELVV